MARETRLERRGASASDRRLACDCGQVERSECPSVSCNRGLSCCRIRFHGSGCRRGREGMGCTRSLPLHEQRQSAAATASQRLHVWTNGLFRRVRDRKASDCVAGSCVGYSGGSFAARDQNLSGQLRALGVIKIQNYYSFPLLFNLISSRCNTFKSSFLFSTLYYLATTYHFKSNHLLICHIL